MFLGGCKGSAQLGKYLRVWLLGHMLRLWLGMELSPKLAVLFCTQLARNESSCCSPFLPAFGIFSFQVLRVSNRCVVACHCCFNLQFSRATNMEPLSMLLAHPYTFFGDLSAQIFCLFLKIGLLFSYCWVFSVLVFCGGFLFVFRYFEYSLSDNVFFKYFSSVLLVFSLC